MHQKDIEIFAYINILDIVPEDDVDNRLLVIVKLRSRFQVRSGPRSGQVRFLLDVRNIRQLSQKVSI